MSKTINNIIPIFLISLFIIACDTKTTFDIDRVRSNIEEQNKKWMNFYNAKDADSVANLFTVDAVVMPPNIQVAKGRKEILNSILDEFKAGATDLVLKTVNVYGNGNLAYEIGEYSLNIKDGDKIENSDQGKYIVVWELSPDGYYKVKVDIWNSDLPIK